MTEGRPCITYGAASLIVSVIAFFLPFLLLFILPISSPWRNIPFVFTLQLLMALWGTIFGAYGYRVKKQQDPSSALIGFVVGILAIFTAVFAFYSSSLLTP